MNCVFLRTILVIYVSILLFSGTSAKIVQSHVFYRHGDRSPIDTFPNDPNGDPSNWPDGFGQLTKLGKKMEYELGSWLRERYSTFIHKVWKFDEVNVHSTDVDRTLMSAQCVLASFYYPTNKTRFETDLEWVPTPIHTAPKKYDKLINVEESCPAVYPAEKEQDNMPEVQAMIKSSKKLFKYLTEKTGKKIDTIVEVDYLFDTLEIQRKYKLKLPDWTIPVWSNMSTLSTFSFKMVALSEKLKRLKAGPMLKEVREHMLSMSKNVSDTHKLYMYSGHDTTIAALLQAMRVYNDIAPPYASCIVIELLCPDDIKNPTEEDFYVQAYYRNSTKTNAVGLTIPGCVFSCPLPDWVKIMNQVIPEDWEAECKDKYEDLISTTEIIFAVVIFLTFLILVYQVILAKRKVNQYRMYAAIIPQE